MSKATSLPNALLYDQIANAVISRFNKLPPKGKPVIRSDGIQEWTTLAGVVLETSQENSLQCVSLATGVKSTPDIRLDEAQGRVLHDMHAEILCLRGFNKFILTECLKLKEHGSKYLEKAPACISANDYPQYQYQGVSDLKIYLYVSEAPCGDSSLCNVADLTEKKANLLDQQVEQWTDPLEPITPDGPLRGRDHFYHTGYVRTKPGRRDSPLTMSKSCSDKLALKQFTSVLLGPTASLVSPSRFYISKLVVPESQLSVKDFDRCFGPTGRLTNVPTDSSVWTAGYSPHFFDCVSTQIEFQFSRRSADQPKPSPQAVLYVQGEELNINKKGTKPSEAIINGTKMGFKPFTSKGGQSIASRLEIAKATRAVSTPLKDEIAVGYLEFKRRNKPRIAVKKQVYEVLQNWVSTKPDDFIF